MNTGRPRKYHFDKMQPGSQAFVPSDVDCISRFQTMIGNVCRYQVGPGNYRTRKVVKGGKYGLIVTRVA